MAEALRILIADEDPDSRVTTRKTLQRAQLGVAGETGFGTQAISFALQLRPDVILVAAEDPVARPLETAESLANALPDTPIILYSSQQDSEAVRRGMLLGARDYLFKPLQSAPLRAAIIRALEQEERRQMRRAGHLISSEARGTVVTVTGAKGGIGKSVLSVNLALALRQETGKSVAILDADTQFGDIATMLDLAPTVTISDLAPKIRDTSRQSIREFLTPHASGIDVLAAPVDEESWMQFDRELLKKLIDLLAQIHEFVIIDTSGSFDGFVRTCVNASTLTLIVTTTEVSSVRDTGVAVRRLDKWGIDPDRALFVLNHGARTSGVSASEVRKAIGREIFWEIPFDKHMPPSVQVGQPLVFQQRKSPSAESIRSLARRIAGTNRSLTDAPKPAPAWRRLLPTRGTSNDTTVAVAPELPPGQR